MKRLTIAAFTCLAALAPAVALAQSPAPAASGGAMSHNAMSHNAMSHNAKSHDAMSHDSMSHASPKP